MSDVSDLTTVVRYLVQDFAISQLPGDIFTYTGSSNIFTLSEPNVVSISAVKVNSAALSSSNYSFDSSTNKLTISSSLTSGDTIEIQYTYYPNYSDSEIEAYIKAAVVYLSVNNYYTFLVDSSDNLQPIAEESEKNLLAFVASILIKPENQSIRLPDITINVPNNLPTRDIISKAIGVFKHNTHGTFDLIE